MVRRYDDAIDVRMSGIQVQDGQASGSPASDGQAHGGQAHGGQAHGGQAHGGQAHGGQRKDSAEGGPGVSQPTAFVWRDRLYVVRAVQTRWYERRAWWREAAAAALLGLRGDDATASAAGSSGRSASRAGAVTGVIDTGVIPTGVIDTGVIDTGVIDTGVIGTDEYLDGETEVWRVEAAAGRSYPVGVFDLARPTTRGGASGGWRLTRVAD